MTPQRAATAIMMYMSAQNDLEAYAEQNIGQIKENVLLSNLSIYIAKDSNAGAFEYDLPVDANTQDFSPQLVGQRKNFSDPVVFQRFLQKAKHKFSLLHIDQRLLILWGHGRGLMMLDDDSSQTVAATSTMAGFSGALLEESSRAFEFNVVVFDACYLGVIETVHQFRNITDYVVTSSTAVPAAGLAYKTDIAALKQTNSAMNSLDLAKLIQTNFEGKYQSLHPGSKKYLYIYDMEKIDDCVDALNGLGKELLDQLRVSPQQTRELIIEAVDLSSKDLPEFVDVLSLCKNIGRKFPASAPIQEALTHLETSVKEGVFGRLGEVSGTPTSPLVWCPVNFNTYEKYATKYNQLDASIVGGEGGWAALWWTLHGSPDHLRPGAPKHFKDISELLANEAAAKFAFGALMQK